PFIFGGIGSYNSNFGKSLSERNSTTIAFSIGTGIPLYQKIFFYGKISYFSKSNYDVYDPAAMNTGSDFQIVNELQSANANFSQLIMNAGLMYNLFNYNGYLLGLNGGMTYAFVNHEAYSSSGVLIQRLDNEGVLGYFAGVMGEKNFEESEFSIFGEAQYNHAKKDVVYFRNAFSGMNYTIGFKYYFTGR
ncbi:MAG: hypothetical protein K9J16_16675, partial [Melioribacteraceae bacterium]|nr:hypothetical protein [Melioribacteraceae bacterium]